MWYESDSITELSQSEIDLTKKLSEQTEDDVTKVHLTVSMWSDDCDPSTGNKRNRNGAWVLTLTLSTQRNTTTGSNNPFIIALGKKGQDHDAVFKGIIENVARININDSPEFHDIKHLTKGNGEYTALCG
eukprot:15281204-Ditylum_brightwellii.AAC.1